MSESTAFIYNVTIKVEAAIGADWLTWLQEIHIPEVLETGCFTEALVTQLREVDDTEGPTYCIQYYASSKADYNRYIEIHAPRLRQKSFNAWGNRFVAFRSLLEIVH